MYKIKDLQFDDKYFASGTTFKTKREACEQLLDYHWNDCNMGIEQEFFDNNKIDKCWEALAQFEWELEKV